MKVLVIVGECIQVNTSSNLCNLAYLHGLVDSGNEVTLITADKHGYVVDPEMKIPDGVMVHSYRSMSLYENLSHKLKTRHLPETGQSGSVSQNAQLPCKKRLMRRLKKWVFNCYGPYGIYIKFAYRALSFFEKEEFDLVISLSNPASSHLLAYRLLRLNRIRTKRWVQIWEDPWYGDVDRGLRTQRIREAERKILRVADRICYVSPITLEYQKKLYPESAFKMMWAPLPTYYENSASHEESVADGKVFGYFGDYYFPTRNLRPFYDVATADGISVNICGNSNLHLQSTDTIRVYPRLHLDELRPIESNTNVLVFLCNCKGGQIPGKIYQYAATRKTILFILDGTEEEQKMLRAFFAPYRRFVFCENTAEQIERAIKAILNGNLDEVSNEPLTAFRPRAIVEGILSQIL